MSRSPFRYCDDRPGRGSSRSSTIRGDLLLCLTEIATNAVEHTDSRNGGKIVVRLSVSEKEILASVTGDGAATSYPKIPAEPDGTCGRGLRLVDALADRCGVPPGGPGTTVWFAIPR